MLRAESPTAERVLRYVTEHPGKSSVEISAALGMKIGTVSSALAALKDVGTVEADKRVAESGRLSFFWRLTGLAPNTVNVSGLPLVDAELTAKFARPEGQAPWWVAFEEVA